MSRCTRKKAQAVVAAAVCAAVGWMSNVGLAQEILPFTESPSKSVAGRTLQESKHQLRTEPKEEKRYSFDKTPLVGVTIFNRFTLLCL